METRLQRQGETDRAKQEDKIGKRNCKTKTESQMVCVSVCLCVKDISRTCCMCRQRCTHTQFHATDRLL